MVKLEKLFKTIWESIPEDYQVKLIALFLMLIGLIILIISAAYLGGYNHGVSITKEYYEYILSSQTCF